jgi:hypothetical protein
MPTKRTTSAFADVVARERIDSLVLKAEIDRYSVTLFDMPSVRP